MPPIQTKSILTTLKLGQLTIKGEFLWGSNYTFLAHVEHKSVTVEAVYKPNRGERPLWDFPSASLAQREVAAYLVSEALGWNFVPPTVYRQQAPIGPGSLQLFVEHDPEYNYFNLSEADHQRLRPVVIFDVLINNADRKGSHILFDPDDHMWLIDHGVCFHREDKMRTVIWDFAGEAIPEELINSLREFRLKLKSETELVSNLQECLNKEETSALAPRTDQLLKSGQFPAQDPNRRPYPWPLL